MNNILQVGAVTSTHGLAGEVKVFPTTDDPKRFKKLPSLYNFFASARLCACSPPQSNVIPIV